MLFRKYSIYIIWDTVKKRRKLLNLEEVSCWQNKSEDDYRSKKVKLRNILLDFLR